jgi:glutamate--cysteine ligase
LTARNSSARLSREDLCTPFHRGVKKPADFRTGIELEYFLVHRDTLGMVTYDEPFGLKWVLEQLLALGWRSVWENETLIGATLEGQKVSIEPGGGLEYASAPMVSTLGIEVIVRKFLAELCPLLRSRGLGLLAAGSHPFETPDSVPLVPKSRYAVMYDYMPRVGTHGRRMMKLTASTQVAIDFSSEADAMRKLRVATQLTPFLMALAANSPMVEAGKSYRCYRGHVWHHTDAARSGVRPLVFRQWSRFEDYVDWALDVPMYFVNRGHHKIALTHQRVTFRHWLDGSVMLPRELDGLKPTMEDWELHLSTLFPWVRLRNYLEIRAMDATALSTALAAPALIRGLFNQEWTLAAAESLLSTLDAPQTRALIDAVALEGMDATLGRWSVRSIASVLLSIAEQGLMDLELGEQHYLKPYAARLDTDWNRDTRRDNPALPALVDAV